MKSNKLLKITGLIFLLLVIAAVIAKATGIAGKKEGIKVEIETIELRDIQETVTASGKIYPETEVKISAEISGEIVNLYIEEGDSVKQGQLLLEINPDIYQSELVRAQATLDNVRAALSGSRSRVIQAEAQLENAQRNFDRNKGLFDKGVISASDFEAVDVALRSAKAEHEIAKENVNASQYTVRSSEAVVSQMRANLKKTSIIAPISGIVSMLDAKEGERVLGTIQMTGTEILRIADMSKLEVHVDVSENDVLRISKGDTAIIEVDAYLGEKFKGLVHHIANSASSDNIMAAAEQATNFKVKILLLKESYKALEKDGKIPFYPGMSSTVDIRTKLVKNAISVPIQSVTTREDSLKKSGDKILEVVFILEGGKSVQKQVKSGIQDDNYIEILSGVNENDNVISGPYNTISRTLKDGKEVTEKEKKPEDKEEE